MHKTAFKLPERLKYKAKMVLVEEVVEESKAMKFVIRIGIVQFTETLQLP